MTQLTPPTSITLNVDGEERTVEARPEMPLLYALRNGLDLKNPRFGCGLSQCGACTVIMDGVAVRSCIIPVENAQGTEITTLAGLGTPDQPHPIQTAFVEETAAQCGYCLNGWIMTSAAFLETNPDPTDAEIREALTGLKCRCGTHMGFLRAVKRAAELRRESAATSGEVNR